MGVFSFLNERQRECLTIEQIINQQPDIQPADDGTDNKQGKLQPEVIGIFAHNFRG